MEQVHVIRHKHFAEGISVRRIALELGLNRRTVQKYLAQSEPRREESNPRPQPVLGPMATRIEALIEEWEPRLALQGSVGATRLVRLLLSLGLALAFRFRGVPNGLRVLQHGFTIHEARLIGALL